MEYFWRRHWIGCITGNADLKKNTCGIAGLDVRTVTNIMHTAGVRKKEHHTRNLEKNIIGSADK